MVHSHNTIVYYCKNTVQMHLAFKHDSAEAKDMFLHVIKTKNKQWFPS